MFSEFFLGRQPSDGGGACEHRVGTQDSLWPEEAIWAILCPSLLCIPELGLLPQYGPGCLGLHTPRLTHGPGARVATVLLRTSAQHTALGSMALLSVNWKHRAGGALSAAVGSPQDPLGPLDP